MIDQKLSNKIFLLVTIIIIIYMLKPSIIFKPNGKFREYGLGYDNEGYKKTMYTMQNIILLMALFIIISE